MASCGEHAAASACFVAVLRGVVTDAPRGQSAGMTDTLVVVDRGRPLAFSFADILRYHGGGSPGGAAIGFKVLERALPLLGHDERRERREIAIETAFGGPGARD